MMPRHEAKTEAREDKSPHPAAGEPLATGDRWLSRQISTNVRVASQPFAACGHVDAAGEDLLLKLMKGSGPESDSGGDQRLTMAVQEGACDGTGRTKKEKIIRSERRGSTKK